jgi:hypothetical protein
MSTFLLSENLLGPSRGLQEVKDLLKYNRKLVGLAGQEGMPPGLGRVSVYGGKFESGPQARDMRELYRCAFPSFFFFWGFGVPVMRGNVDDLGNWYFQAVRMEVKYSHVTLCCACVHPKCLQAATCGKGVAISVSSEHAYVRMCVGMYIMMADFQLVHQEKL